MRRNRKLNKLSDAFFEDLLLALAVLLIFGVSIIDCGCMFSGRIRRCLVVVDVVDAVVDVVDVGSIALFAASTSMSKC